MKFFIKVHFLGFSFAGFYLGLVGTGFSSVFNKNLFWFYPRFVLNFIEILSIFIDSSLILLILRLVLGLNLILFLTEKILVLFKILS